MKTFKLLFFISTLLANTAYAAPTKKLIDIQVWKKIVAEPHPILREEKLREFFDEIKERVIRLTGDDSQTNLHDAYFDVYRNFNKALELRKDATHLEKAKALIFASNTLFNENIMSNGNDILYKKHFKDFFNIYNEILESKKLTEISHNEEDAEFYDYYFENRMNIKIGLFNTQVEIIPIINIYLNRMIPALNQAGNNIELLNSLKEPIEKEFHEAIDLINESIELSRKQFHIFQKFGLFSDVDIGIEHLNSLSKNLENLYSEFKEQITPEKMNKIPTITSSIERLQIQITKTIEDFKEFFLIRKFHPFDSLHEFTYAMIKGIYYEEYLTPEKEQAVLTLKKGKKIEDILNTVNSDLVQFTKSKDKEPTTANKILEESTNLYHILFNTKLSDKQYTTLFKILDLWNGEFVHTSNVFAFACNKKIRRIFENKKKLDNTSFESEPKKKNTAPKKINKNANKKPAQNPLPLVQTPNPSLSPAVSSSPVAPPPTVTHIDDKGKEEDKAKIEDMGESEETTITVSKTYVPKKAKKQNSKNRRKRLQKEFKEKLQKLISEELKPLSDEGLDIILEQDEAIVEQEEFLDEEVGKEELEPIEDPNVLEKVDSEEILAEDINDLPEENSSTPHSEEVKLDKEQQMKIAHARLYKELDQHVKNLLDYDSFYIVGGWVRDRLKNLPSNDYDILFVGYEHQLIEIIKQFGGKCAKVKGPHTFPIYRVTFPGKEPIDITRQRSDRFNLKINAFSRDTPINALYFTKYKIIDPTGRGWYELMNDNARITSLRKDHKKSFSYDPKRMFRFVITKNKFNRNLSDDLTVGIFENCKLIANIPVPIFLEFMLKLFKVSKNREYALKESFLFLHEVFPDFRISDFEKLIGEKKNLSIYNLLYAFLHNEIQNNMEMIPEYNIDEAILMALDRVNIPSTHTHFEAFRSILLTFFQNEYSDVINNEEDYAKFLNSTLAKDSDASDLSGHQVDVLTRASDITDPYLLQNLFRPGSILFFIYWSNILRFQNH